MKIKIYDTDNTLVSNEQVAESKNITNLKENLSNSKENLLDLKKNINKTDNSF